MFSDNTALLKDLFTKKQIALEDGDFLRTIPAPLPAGWDFSRAEGMLLGLAIGDSLGNTSESLSYRERKRRFGEIRDYPPNLRADERPVGLPSDDSQLAFWTLEQLIEDGGLIPDRLAYRFSRQKIYGIGNTVRSFVYAYKNLGKGWRQAGQPSAGNGALMRIAPVLVPHLRQPSPSLWADAVLAAMITHNDRASNAACAAFISILWDCLRLEQTPEPIWWVDQFVTAARDVEGNTRYSPNGSQLTFRGPLWKFVDSEVRQAVRERWTVLEACERWYSGAYLLETLPCALYILARHAGDPEEAVVRAVNDSWDNDTIAAIVGAAVGALHGRGGFPPRWVEGLLGRTGEDDDGQVFRLIEAARQRFWEEAPQPADAGIAAVLSFLPVFEDPEFKSGEWVTQEGSLPYVSYSKAVLEFIAALGANGFIYPFDWMHWEEGLRLHKEPELVQQADLPTLRKLLTAYVRQDRFSEGALADAIDSGKITGILRRLAELQPRPKKTRAGKTGAALKKPGGARRKR